MTEPSTNSISLTFNVKVVRILTLLIAVGMTLSSCRTPIYTAVNLPSSQTYKQPTLLLLSDTITHGFMREMATEFKERFDKEGITTDIRLIRLPRLNAAVLSQTQLDSVALATSTLAGSDLLVLINPTHSSTHTPGGAESIWSTTDRLVNIMFQIVAFDAKTDKRVWTAALEISSENSYGYPGWGIAAFDGTGSGTPVTTTFKPSPPPPSILKDADKSVNIICKKLKSDKVISAPD